jgi:hypothetical protein
MRSEETRCHLAVLVVLAVITLVMTYPLILQLGNSLRDPGDPLLNAWILAWDVEQLTTGNVAGFFDANIFFPHDRTLAYSEHLFTQSLVALVPLLIWDNPVLAHNLVTLLAMLTSAFGMYLLARYLTKDPVAGLAAGVVYGFSPFMFDHLVHVQVLTAGGIPLVFLFLVRLFERERWSDLAWLWLFTVLQMLANGYYAVYLAFFVSTTIAYHVLTAGKLRDPRFVKMLAVFALGVALATGPFIYQYVAFQQEMGFQRIVSSHAEISSFVSAPWYNRLYGGWLPDRPEARLFPGFIAVVLAAFGSVWTFRSGRPDATNAKSDFSLSNPRRWFFFFLAIFVFSVLASFGTSIPGPYHLLFDYVPGFNGLRSAARIHIMTLNSLAVLAAFGVAGLRTGSQRLWLRRVAAVGIPSLLLAEYFSAPIPTTRMPTVDELPPVYQWLGQDPDGGPILELPLTFPGPRKNLPEIARVYASTTHWRRMINGYSGFPPHVYREIRKRWDLLGPEQVLADARSLGVQQVLVDADRFRGDGLQNTRAALSAMTPPAVKIIEIDGVEVWGIADSGGTRAPIGRIRKRRFSSSGWQLKASANPELAELAIDGDPSTRWRCEPHQVLQTFTVDLGSTRRVSGVELAHGRNRNAFPRGLVVELSTAADGWQVVAERRFDRLPIEAFLRPLEFPLIVEFEPAEARYLRLTNTSPHARASWLIGEIRIW